MFAEKDILNIINVYNERGIVTRNDHPNLDSRPLSHEIYDELRKRGYKEVMMVEAHLDGWVDYSRAIYNPNRFEVHEAEEYLIKNVLYR